MLPIDGSYNALVIAVVFISGAIGVLVAGCCFCFCVSAVASRFRTVSSSE